MPSNKPNGKRRREETHAILRALWLLLRLICLPLTLLFYVLLLLWSLPFRLADMVRRARNPFVCEDALTRFLDEADPSVRFWDLYCCFRHFSLSRKDSFFNAHYTYLCQKAYHGRARRAPRGIPRHPFGWYGAEHAHLPRLGALFLLKIVTVLPKLLSVPQRISASAKRFSRAMDSSRSAVGSTVRFLKKWGAVLTPCVLALIVGLTIGFYARMETTVVVRIDGEVIGYAESRRELFDAVQEAENAVSQTIGMNFKLPKNVSYSLTKKINPTYLSKAELVAKFEEYTRSFMESGYGLYVEGELVAASADEQVLNRLLADAQASAEERSEALHGEDAEEKAEGEESAQTAAPTEPIRLLTDARVVPQSFPPEAYLSEEEFSTLLSSVETKDGGVVYRLSAYTPKTVPVAKKLPEGEAYCYTMDYAKSLNEKKREVSLVYGFVKTEEAEEVAAFPIKYQSSDAVYEGTQFVEQRGVPGKKKTTYEIEYCGDTEYSRKAVDEVILEQPVEQIVLIGTKPLPSASEEGKQVFLYPVPPLKGVSSYYGDRENPNDPEDVEFHNALDIPGTDTTPVYAAASGIVVEAGETGTTYGIAVKIQHENGMFTYYAHLSDEVPLKVKVGDYVTRNQMIGNVGTTGYVTGPHVHFEVRNEANYTLNPIYYLLDY